MLLNDDEIKERIESPLNLLNRLKSSLTKASVHKHSPPEIPSLPPAANDIIPDLDEKIAGTTAKAKAMNIMISAMTELQERIGDVHKPETLSRIVYNMGRVIASQNENRYDHRAGMTSQIIVYAPQVKTLDNFDIIDVVE